MVPTGPDVGDIEVTLGEYVKSAVGVLNDVPLLVVTVTATWPVPGGETAVISVSLLTVKLADASPKCTFSAPVNPVPDIFTVVPPEAGPVLGVMPVIEPAEIPLKASPLVSTAAQKLVFAQDTDVRLALLSVGIRVVLQLLPPLHSSARPELSTATQNVDETQETALGEPIPCLFIGFTVQAVPFQVIKFALLSTAMQNEDEVHETPDSPPFWSPLPSNAVGPAHFPLLKVK